MAIENVPLLLRPLAFEFLDNIACHTVSDNPTLSKIVTPN